MSASDFAAAGGSAAGNTGHKDYTISINGMSCQHCVGAVRKALDAVQGVHVRSVQVGSAAVSVDSARASIDDVLEAIRDSGYEPAVS